MLDFAIGCALLAMAASLYIGGKIAETIQIRRHRRAKTAACKPTGRRCYHGD